MCELLVDVIIEKLEALETLPDRYNVKLGVADDRLYLCWFRFNGFQRMWNGDDRKETVTFISTCIQELVAISDYLIHNIKRNINIQINAAIINKIREKMPVWCKKLTLLQRTYEGDSDTISSLTAIIRIIEQNLEAKIE
jgi:hypothetical protein